MSYFYTDPLAAAWQAKRHGMKFEGFDTIEIEDYQIAQAVLKSIAPTMVAVCIPSTFIIRPDSLHLLEAREGDAIKTPTLQGIYVIGESVMCDKNGMGVPHHSYLTMKDVLSIQNRWGNPRIIERNRTAFMWPERESE